MILEGHFCCVVSFIKLSLVGFEEEAIYLLSSIVVYILFVVCQHLPIMRTNIIILWRISLMEDEGGTIIQCLFPSGEFTRYSIPKW